jgi:dolichol-phosphate mannosyltransferase
MPRLSIIVPTYCEADNLPELSRRIAAALREEPYSFEIIVVDDNSPDDTVNVCHDLAKEFPLRLIVRTQERGLSSAVIAGMQQANGELLICMDADLSHPPESIPELVAALENPRTDFVIGSRYVRGGSTEDGWGVFRWLNSRAATWLSRPLTSASDPMAGFFGLRRETFLSANELNPIGYKIGLELLVKCGCERVAEVPIQFSNRLHGQSKLSLREQVNYLRHLYRLYRFRFGVWARGAEFLLVGFSGAFVDLVVLSLMLTSVPFEVARTIAIMVAMNWNFVLNRTFTFADSRQRSIGKQYLGFVTACALGAVANWTISVALRRSLIIPGNNPLIAAAVGVIAGALFNFLLCNMLVFRGKRSETEQQVSQSSISPKFANGRRDPAERTF